MLQKLFYKVILCVSLLLFNNILIAQNKTVDSLKALTLSKKIEEQQEGYIGLAEYYNDLDNQLCDDYLNKTLINIKDISSASIMSIIDRKFSIYLSQDKFQKAEEELLHTLSEGESRKDSNLIAYSYAKLSSVYLQQFKYSMAHLYNDKALAIYEALGNDKEIGSAFINKGHILYAEGEYTRAMENALKAAEILKNTDQNKQLAIAYLQLGNMNYLLMEIDEAENYYKLSTEYHLRAQDSLGWALTYSNLGLIKLYKNEFQEALEHQLKALPHILKSNREISIGNTYHYIGDAYIGLKQADSAEKYIRKSIYINQKSFYYTGISFDQLALGKIAFLRNDIDSAIYYGEQSILSLDSMENFELAKDANLLLSECYEQKNDIKTAFHYLKQHLTIKDSLNLDQKEIKNQVFIEQSKIEQAEYELKLAKERDLIRQQEYKNQQILIFILSIITLLSIFFAILITTTNRRNKLLNKQLQEKQELLKKELKNKQALIREIHHRVKNNLQVISSMLSIQSRYFEDEKFHDLIRESKGRIKSMALIHESLYKRTEGEDAIFSTYVKDLLPTLISTYDINKNNIDLKMDIDDIELSLDDSIPCGLIINEIISNSLKHAFPDNKDGEISIKMKKEGDTIQLFISDNGVGFPNKVTPDLNDSFGMLLIDSLVSQLEAQMIINTENGVSYDIQWEANDDKLLD